VSRIAELAPERRSRHLDVAAKWWDNSISNERWPVGPEVSAMIRRQDRGLGLDD
jgi:hypothetical protein